jgi:hypothetical protein
MKRLGIISPCPGRGLKFYISHNLIGDSLRIIFEQQESSKDQTFMFYSANIVLRIEQPKDRGQDIQMGKEKVKVGKSEVAALFITVSRPPNAQNPLSFFSVMESKWASHIKAL